MNITRKKHRLILIFIFIASLFLFMFLPKTTAYAEDDVTAILPDNHTHTNACTSASMLDGKAYLLKNEVYYLSGNLEDKQILVEEGYEATLCLNGFNIEYTGQGSPINVDNGGTLTLCDCEGTGHITGDVTVGNGGGVYVNGNFTMYGGTISDCNTPDEGGGVYVKGTFTMYGGEISGNTASNGGGVYVNGGTFNMTSGTISGNYGSVGGGVYVANGSFTMENGAISGNTANHGGGVYVYGEFTMKNGTISGNEAEGNGGGVYVNGGTFTMCGGTINGNEAVENGGGVCIGSVGKLKVSGAVTIMENTNGEDANNVYFAHNLIEITDTLTEGAKIGVNNVGAAGAVAGYFTQEGNPADFFIPDDAAYDCIYVDDSKFNRVIIATHDFTAWAYGDTNHWHVCANCGESQGDEEAHIFEDGECTECGYVEHLFEVIDSQNNIIWFSKFTAAWSAADDAGTATVTMYADAEISSTLTVSENNTITLDLNGCMLKYTNSGYNPVITVNGNFTLKDDSENGGGVITGGNNYGTGGGVYVNGGTFNMTSGTISGNYGGAGGGVYVNGSFTMSGGTITNNTANKGSGVCVGDDSTFTMTGGTVSGNTAEIGGGVYLGSTYNYESTGTFTMTGGIISGNTATTSDHNYGGGGVYVYMGCTFEMTGGEISENESSTSGGVYVKGGTFKMSNGTINGNTASMISGGVCVDVCVDVYGNTFNGTFEITGGEITGNTAMMGGGVMVAYDCTFNLSGVPDITGNTAMGVSDNVATASAITITGELEKDGEKAQIGISSAGGMLYGIVIVTGFTQSDDLTGYFILDNPDECIYISDTSNGEITLDEHTGTATCVAKAVCENCGIEFGDFGDHSFTAWENDNTNHWHVCANCGESQNDEAAHSGTDDGDCTTAVTCTCGYEITVARNHNYSADYARDENQHWKVCQNEGCTQISNKGNHSGTDDGDCTTRIICTYCVYEIKAAEAEHNYSATWTTDENQHWHVCQNTDCTQNDTKENHSGTATCIAKAVCDKCGEEYGNIGTHTLNSVAQIDKTCTADGVLAHDHCSECNKDFIDGVEKTAAELKIVAAHTWDSNSIRVEPDCTTDGSVTGTCTICGTNDVEVLPKLGHDKVQHEAKPATCTEKGWNAYETCSRCDYTSYAEITALGHTEEIINAKAPTCTESGLTSGKRCLVCNSILEGLEPVGALGHSYGEWTTTISASCTEKGEETRICAHNSEHKETKEISALGHTVETANAKAPTCTESGLTSGKRCSVCNIILEGLEPVGALGHSYGEWTITISASCTEKGEETRICAHNSEHKETKEISALGHNYGEWVVTKEATIEAEGEEKRVCENDDTHFETRTLPKLSKNGISSGAIVGITLSILIVLLLAAYILCYFLLYRKEILLKGKVWDIIYTPMNAIFKKKDSYEENEVDSVSEDEKDK